MRTIVTLALATTVSLLIAYLLSLYVWLRTPERPSGLFWSFFLLSLSVSNHQLALPLAFLPFLVVAAAPDQCRRGAADS